MKPRPSWRIYYPRLGLVTLTRVGRGWQDPVTGIVLRREPSRPDWTSDGWTVSFHTLGGALWHARTTQPSAPSDPPHPVTATNAPGQLQSSTAPAPAQAPRARPGPLSGNSPTPASDLTQHTFVRSFKAPTPADPI
jgi:hypothetical protein